MNTKQHKHAKNHTFFYSGTKGWNIPKHSNKIASYKWKYPDLLILVFIFEASFEIMLNTFVCFSPELFYPAM